MPATTVIEGRIVNQRPYYRLRFTHRNSSAFLDGDAAWKPIRNVVPCGTGRVYNLSVADDESYVADGCVVHNCQPFSIAGKKQGKSDNRYLWPQMLRVIDECQPTFIIGENVAGILSMAERYGHAQVESRSVAHYSAEDVYEAVCTQQERMQVGEIGDDLARLGYEVAWLVIPACAVNAPHRRDRVWIVGYSEHARRLAAEVRGSGMAGGQYHSPWQNEIFQSARPDGAWPAPDARRQSGDGGCECERGGSCDQQRAASIRNSSATEMPRCDCSLRPDGAVADSQRPPLRGDGQFGGWQEKAQQALMGGQGWPASHTHVQSGVGRPQPQLAPSASGQSWPESIRSDASFAHPAGIEQQGHQSGVCRPDAKRESHRHQNGEARADYAGSVCQDGAVAHAPGQSAGGHASGAASAHPLSGNPHETAAHPDPTGRREQRGAITIREELAAFERADWRQVEPLLRGSDDAVPARLDAAERYRRERLKALGNAIDPLVPYPLLKGIADFLRSQETD